MKKALHLDLGTWPILAEIAAISEEEIVDSPILVRPFELPVEGGILNLFEKKMSTWLLRRKEQLESLHKELVRVAYKTKIFSRCAHGRDPETCPKLDSELDLTIAGEFLLDAKDKATLYAQAEEHAGIVDMFYMLLRNRLGLSPDTDIAVRTGFQVVELPKTETHASPSMKPGRNDLEELFRRFHFATGPENGDGDGMPLGFGLVEIVMGGDEHLRYDHLEEMFGGLGRRRPVGFGFPRHPLGRG